MPLLSVIITSKDAPEHLERLLESIIKNTQVEYEIIVGDNSEDTEKLYARLPGALRSRIIYLPNHKAVKGWPGNANRCIMQAQGLYLTLPFSEDAEVSPGWEIEAINCCKGNVGQVAFKILFGQHQKEQIVGAEQPNGESLGYVAKGLMPRFLYEYLGLYDENFYYGADIDLSWRIQAAGFEIKDCPQAIIYHHHDSRNYFAIDLRHMEKLKGKWRALQ
jgi:GT2 family glycosyltransferase